MHELQAAWDFAVALYGRPGVSSACIALQDRRGADVIVMLGLINRAVRGASAPSDSRLRQALTVAQPFSDGVQAIREQRRLLKRQQWDNPQAVAQIEAALPTIIGTERASERAELAVFLPELGLPERQSADALGEAARALSTYWRVAGLDCDATDRASIGVILAQAFPDQAARAAIEQAFT